MSSYKDREDADKKIKDVRKHYHNKKNYIYSGLMTDWGLSPFPFGEGFFVDLALYCNNFSQLDF